ncbi:MAG: zinc ribbon domain-containing protein [Anaerolineales bacterium]|nr:zinc ribbon domain-containing protein [Anaerolineales bacterium]
MAEHYCFQCGRLLEVQRIDHRDREVCPVCSWVYYHN